MTVFANQWSSEAAFHDAHGRDPDFDFEQEFPDLAPGGIYDDFTLATIAELYALAESAGIDTSVFDATNYAAARELVGLLGPTYGGMTPDDQNSSIGFVDDFIGSGDVRGIAEIQYDPGDDSGVRIGMISNAYHSVYVGLWLHRTTIPEPSSAVLVLLFTSFVWASAFPRR